MKQQGAEAFDGIICIGGEDWWYHNRGHFDFQIMRRIARRWPVLFVNSLAVRMPSPVHDKQFAARIGRKLKSLSRGIVNVENNFWVFSPVNVPGETGQKLSNWALAPQIKLAARRAGIRRPVVWMHCPAGAGLVGGLNERAVVLQRTDRFEAFPEADGAIVGGQIQFLKGAADLAVYCNPHLMAEEAGSVASQLLVTHGVDYDAFVAAGDEQHDPADMAAIAHPRAGFIGGIDAHTFDPPLFLEVARRLPHVSFVMVGGSSLPAGWCDLPNVHFLGRKPYDEIARYQAAMDVLLMPWNKSDWIQACNPIKLKEYLAVGRPVVTTDFPALDGWRDLVTVATEPAAFANAITAALAVPYWDAKAQLVMDGIEGLGVSFEAACSRRAAKASG